MTNTFYEVVSKDSVLGAFWNKERAQRLLSRMAPGLRGYIRARQRHDTGTSIADLMKGK